MKLQGRLFANALVTMIGIIVVGSASLIGFYEVKRSVHDLKDNTTPYQIKTLEFSKTLQEHASGLFEASNASLLTDVKGKEEELNQTIRKLKKLASEIASIEKTEAAARMNPTVNEVEGLTRQIIRITEERIESENAAAVSVIEAQQRLSLLADDRSALEESLKKLQEGTIADLTKSSSRSKTMIEQFRAVQRARDFFQGLQSGYNDIERARDANDLAIARGRITFALKGIAESVETFPYVKKSAATVEEQILSTEGLVARKLAALSHPESGETQQAFRDSWKKCSFALDQLEQKINENAEDATAAFYSENVQLGEKLAKSDSVGRVMLLSTQMATITDAVQYWVQNLFVERSALRIEETRKTISKLFAESKTVRALMGEALASSGQSQTDQKLMKDVAEGLDRVQDLSMKPGGMIETLAAAATARDRSRELDRRLDAMIRSEKEAGDKGVLEAQGQQQKSASFVDFVVRSVTILLVAGTVAVLLVTVWLGWVIGRSIIVLVKDLQAAKEEAESASRAKSQFLANISHEIRTPMNGVLGLLELLKASTLAQKQRNYVNTALSSGMTLLGVINDVLDFSKIEAGQMQLSLDSFDLPGAVEETVGFLAEQAQAKGIELLCHLTPDTPAVVKGDAMRLRQVLINLLGNAVKFTAVGQIVVKVTPMAGQGGLSCRFEVSDTGIGIPEHAQEKIFDSFSQADASTTRKFGGTGLGLSIAKQLVHMMGGEIGVKSTVGAGSTFWFTVPFGKGAEGHETGKAASARPGLEVLKGLKVLVVDDNDTNRQILDDMLEAWGLLSQSVPSGREALEALEAASGTDEPFRLAILDMMMPGMDGLELARAIKNTPGIGAIPLIMLTSLDGTGELEASKETGIAIHLVKPVRQSQLLNALASLLGASAKSGEKEKEKGPTQLEGIRVLLAEDHKVNQDVGKAMLEYLGCSPEVAENGKVALDLYSRKPYDLILMDCQMPEMDGYETTKAIRKIEADRGSHIAIIALTAHAMDGDREKSLAAGMDDHLNKPYTIEQLKSILLKHCGQQQQESVPVEAGISTQEPAAAGRVPDSAETNDAIDRAALEIIRKVDGNGGDLVRTVVGHYLSESPKILENLKKAVDARDGAAIQKLSHGLKSSSANVGARSLADLCKQMEFAGRSDALGQTPELLTEIEREYSCAETALNAEL